MSTSSIPSPLYTTWTRWVSSVILTEGLLPRPEDEQRWKAWATEVARIDGTAPDPMPFADWRTWALAWVGTH